MRLKTPYKVTRETALAVRKAYSRGASTKVVADLFDLGHHTICRIVTGQHRHTKGMVNIARSPGRPCDHSVPTARSGRRRCIHGTGAATK